MVLTGNIPYLSLITWVSLTSIKEMEHSPDEFKVGRWSWHSCLGCQVEGGNLDPSESNIFSVSKCAICSSMIVFKRRHLNSFREQLSRTDTGIRVTRRNGNGFRGSSLFPFHWREQEKNMEQRMHLEHSQDSLDTCEEADKSKSSLIFIWEAKVAKPETWSMRCQTGCWGGRETWLRGFS